MASILYALLFSLTSLAQTDRVCTDLAKFACAPGEYDDGTGKANTEGVLDDKADGVFRRATDRAKQQIQKALMEPDSGALRRGVLSASGLLARKDCANADDRPSGECLKLMAEYTANLIYQGGTKLRDVSAVSGGDIDDRFFIIQLPAYVDLRDKLMGELRNEMKADELDARVKKMAIRLKELLIAKIEAKVADPAMKKIMTDRVRDAKPGTTCDSNHLAAVPEYMVPNAFYNFLSRGANFCFGNSIRSNSTFAIAQAMLHELAHPLGPCGIQVGPKDFSYQYKSKTYPDAEKEYPLPGLIRCLRKKSSVAAIRNVDFRPPAQPLSMGNPNYPQNYNPATGTYDYGYGGNNYRRDGASDPSKAEPEPFYSFCYQDQIDESVSDWWANEVLPDYIAENPEQLTVDQIRIGYSNTFRSACNEDEMKDGRKMFDTHPTARRRMDFLLLMQPKIRKQMSCPEQLPADREYCNGEALPEDEHQSEVVVPNNPWRKPTNKIHRPEVIK